MPCRRRPPRRGLLVLLAAAAAAALAGPAAAQSWDQFGGYFAFCDAGVTAAFLAEAEEARLEPLHVGVLQVLPACGLPYGERPLTQLDADAWEIFAAATLALRVVNADPLLLPGRYLVPVAFNTGFLGIGHSTGAAELMAPGAARRPAEYPAVEAVLLGTGTPVVAGDLGMAYNVPVVGHFLSSQALDETSSLLSETAVEVGIEPGHLVNTPFTSVAVSPAFEARALVALCATAGFSSVAVLRANGEHTLEVASLFVEAAAAAGIVDTVVFSFDEERQNNSTFSDTSCADVAVHIQVEQALLAIKRLGHRVVLLSAFVWEAVQVMCESERLGMTAADGYQWIGTEAFLFDERLVSLGVVNGVVGTASTAGRGARQVAEFRRLWAAEHAARPAMVQGIAEPHISSSAFEATYLLGGALHESALAVAACAGNATLSARGGELAGEATRPDRCLEAADDPLEEPHAWACCVQAVARNAGTPRPDSSVLHWALRRQPLGAYAPEEGEEEEGAGIAGAASGGLIVDDSASSSAQRGSCLEAHVNRVSWFSITDGPDGRSIVELASVLEAAAAGGGDDDDDDDAAADGGRVVDAEGRSRTVECAGVDRTRTGNGTAFAGLVVTLGSAEPWWPAATGRDGDGDGGGEGWCAAPRDRPRTVVTYERASRAAAASMYALLSLGMAVVAGLLAFNVYYQWRRVPLILLSSPNINSVSLVGLAVTLAGAFAAARAARVPDLESKFVSLCRAQLWLFSLGFSLAVGALLAKTYRVHRLMNVYRGGRRVPRLHDSHLLLTVAALVLTDVVALGAAWIFAPVERRVDTRFVIESAAEVVIEARAVCQPADALSLYLLVTKVAILVFGAWLAFQVRKTRVKQLNDSHEIGQAVYSIVVWCVGVVPTVLLVDDTQALMLVECLGVFGIVTSSAVLLFGKKVHAVYTRAARGKGAAAGARRGVATPMAGAVPAAGGGGGGASGRTTGVDTPATPNDDVEMSVPTGGLYISCGSTLSNSKEQQRRGAASPPARVSGEAARASGGGGGGGGGSAAALAELAETRRQLDEATARVEELRGKNEDLASSARVLRAKLALHMPAGDIDRALARVRTSRAMTTPFVRSATAAALVSSSEVAVSVPREDRTPSCSDDDGDGAGGGGILDAGVDPLAPGGGRAPRLEPPSLP